MEGGHFCLCLYMGAFDMRPDRVRQRYGLRADMESAPYVLAFSLADV